jgi:hypothetical protein
MPTGLALAEGFFAFGFVFSVAGLWWIRDKPESWVPPAWYSAGYFGPMTRWRFKLNCVVGLIAFPILAAITYLAIRPVLT